MKEERIKFPCVLVGVLVGKQKEYIAIDSMQSDEFEAFLKEVAKFDYKFNRGIDIISAETKIDGKAAFVDVSVVQYKSLCNLYFKNKLNSSEREM